MTETLFLAEIAAYLASGGLGTVGTNIFVSPNLPDVEGAELITMLFEYGGMASGLTMDGAECANPSLQVRVRAGKFDYASGIGRIKAVEALLHGKANLTIGSHNYKLIQAMGSPNYIGRDEKGRPEWTQNYHVMKEA